MENSSNPWRSGLSKTRNSPLGKITSFLGISEIEDTDWDQLEELLIQADLGVETSQNIAASLRERVQDERVLKKSDLRDLISSELIQRLIPAPELSWESRPVVILIVGVNGSGKTTSMAKLGAKFQEQGMKVLFGAADTYRAAAVDQLKSWGQRLDIPVIGGQAQGDPGAVTFDTIQSGISRQMDIVMIDTAGRLHTQYNLMEELKKVHRVAGKALPGAPHAVWLVLDATTGQNAIYQAEAFQEAVDLDGVILAKLDTSSRGGMVFAIQEKLGLPLLFAGLGEGPEDLVPFDPEAFVAGILE
jgi:fused signal recognition particle receptor